MIAQISILDFLIVAVAARMLCVLRPIMIVSSTVLFGLVSPISIYDFLLLIFLEPSTLC